MKEYTKELTNLVKQIKKDTKEKKRSKEYIVAYTRSVIFALYIQLRKLEEV